MAEFQYTPFIEIMIFKASVDPEFKKILLNKRASAAGLIHLQLDPDEARILNSLPSATLENVISRVTLQPQYIEIFRGDDVRKMVVAFPFCNSNVPENKQNNPAPLPPGGARPDRPSPLPERKNPYGLSKEMEQTMDSVFKEALDYIRWREQEYKREHGKYETNEEFKANEADIIKMFGKKGKFNFIYDYDFKIEIKDNTFAVTFQHKTDPEQHPKYTIGK